MREVDLNFKQKVSDIVKKIPKGKTLSYKEVAARAGNPRAARAVGMIMSKNQDKNIPCHRVIRSDGKTGGYNGLQGKSKKELLRFEELNRMGDDLLKNKKLPLFAYRTENKYFPVVGEGSCFAKIVFIGEAPGKNEAKTGRPFCGASGKMLDELLNSIGMDRKDVYITNIVKDRPPENRDPTPDEIKLYGPYLDKQLEIIQPKVLATLGRYSMEYVMRKFGLESELLTISQMHGKSFKAKASWGNIVIIPLYHPAAAIYNQRLKNTLKKDFEILKQYAKHSI